MEELLQRQERRFEDVIKEHDKMIQKMAMRFYRSQRREYRLEYDDLYQEGLIAMYRAFRTYKGDLMDFERYLYVVLKRRMARVIMMHASRDECIITSLDRDIYTDHHALFTMSARRTDDPRIDFKIKEFKENLEKIYDGLSPLQKEISDLRASGHTQKEIASKMGLSTKKVEYEISKIKKILRRYTNERA